MTSDTDIRRLFEAAVVEVQASGDLLEAPMARLQRSRRRDRLVKAAGSTVLAVAAAAVFVTIPPSREPLPAGAAGGPAARHSLPRPSVGVVTSQGYQQSLATAVGPTFVVSTQGPLTVRVGMPTSTVTASQQLSLAKGAAMEMVQLTVSVAPRTSQSGWRACADLGAPNGCSRRLTRGGAFYEYVVGAQSGIRVVTANILVDARPLSGDRVLSAARLADVLLSADVTRETEKIGNMLLAGAFAQG